MTGELVRHKRSDCPGGWSAVAEQRLFGDDRPRWVELICWACGAVTRFTAYTEAADDPGGYDYRPTRLSAFDDAQVRALPELPAEHRPFLAVSTSGTWQYPASVDPDRVARHLVYVERWLWDHDPYEWVVADRDGNVLGYVQTYRTPRGADRFRWGTPGGGQGGDGCKTRDAAVRLLVRTVGAQ